MIELGPAEWRGYRQPDFPHDHWRIEGDCLVADAQASRVDLISRRRFAAFVFHFEVALPRGGNSGVLHGVGEESEQSWHSGLEMQLLDDAVHSDGRQPLTRHGALYGLRPALPTNIEPFRFQRGMLRVDADGRVKHWLEGRCVLAYVRDDTALRVC